MLCLWQMYCTTCVSTCHLVMISLKFYMAVRPYIRKVKSCIRESFGSVVWSSWAHEHLGEDNSLGLWGMGALSLLWPVRILKIVTWAGLSRR